MNAVLVRGVQYGSGVSVHVEEAQEMAAEQAFRRLLDEAVDNLIQSAADTSATAANST